MRTDDRVGAGCKRAAVVCVEGSYLLSSVAVWPRLLVSLPLDVVVVNGRLMLHGAWNLRQHFYARQIIVHK